MQDLAREHTMTLRVTGNVTLDRFRFEKLVSGTL